MIKIEDLFSFPTKLGFSCHFSGDLYSMLSKNSWPPNVVYSQVQMVCFGRTRAYVWQIFLQSIHKKIQVFWQQQKTFHSIFTYCRCLSLLLNGGGSDLLVTCGLILHLLFSFVPC